MYLNWIESIFLCSTAFSAREQLCSSISINYVNVHIYLTLQHNDLHVFFNLVVIILTLFYISELLYLARSPHFLHFNIFVNCFQSITSLTCQI